MIVLLLPLVLGLALFAAGALAVRWFVRADPQKLASGVRTGGAVGMLLVGVALMMRGQAMLGASLVGAALARLRGSPATFPGGGPFPGGPFPGGPFPGGPGWGGRRGTPRGGGASTVRTRFVEARLDHDTGNMDGTVQEGAFRGSTLSGLSDADLLALWREASGDGESRLVLEAYLDRRRPEWREDVEADGDFGAGGAAGAGRARGNGPLTEDEAYELLGLQPGATEAEIRQRHRGLMKKVHPDQGGSAALAAQLNEARDVLLRRGRGRAR